MSPSGVHDGAKGVSTPYVEYTYDQTASGGELTKGYRLTKIRYPNGRLVHYTYGSAASTADNLNRLDAIKDDNAGVPGNVLASYTYLGSGTVVKIDYQQPDVRLDLIDTGHAYSGFDRFMRIVDQRWFDYGSSVDADRYKYGYDRASSRKYRENTLTSAKDEFYTYDGMHRLETFDRGDLNGTYTGMTGTPVREQDWTLDELGNWAQFVQRSSGSTDLDHSRDHDKANELTQFNTTSGLDWQDPVYDRNGNATSIPRPSSPISSFALTYDAWNRMVTLKLGVLTLGSYEYDGFSRRVQTTSGSTVRHFYYSDRWQALEERLGASTSAESQYIWGLRYIDELILRERDTDGNGSLNERLYYLQDANFNVTALVNTTGTVQERYAYEPYGDLIVLTPAWGSRSSSSFANPFTYTGRRRDSESGLYYFRHRMYHMLLGTFISRDGLGYRREQYHLTRYVNSRPLNAVDPSGLAVMIPTFVIKEMDCDEFLDWLQAPSFTLPRLVSRMFACGIHVFCGNCGSTDAVTFPQDRRCHVCLPANSPKQAHDIWIGLLLHESKHCDQFLRLEACTCEKGTPPTFGDPIAVPPLRRRPCRTCKSFEEPAYELQCAYLFPNNREKQKRCVASGVCHSCRHVCGGECPPSPPWPGLG